MSHQRINAMCSSKEIMHGLLKEDALLSQDVKKKPKPKTPHFFCCFSTATKLTVSLPYVQKAVVATCNINTDNQSFLPKNTAFRWNVMRQITVSISDFMGAVWMRRSAHTQTPCKTKILITICKKNPTNKPNTKNPEQATSLDKGNNCCSVSRKARMGSTILRGLGDLHNVV